jgi:hypothetical protein
LALRENYSEHQYTETPLKARRNLGKAPVNIELGLFTIIIGHIHHNIRKFVHLLDQFHRAQKIETAKAFFSFLIN